VAVAVAALAPLAYSGIMYLRHGRFEDVGDLLNRAEPAPQIELRQEAAGVEITPAGRLYQGLSAGSIGILALCLIAGGLAAWKLKREQIGDYLRVSVSAKAATGRADAVLREHGLDPRKYYQATLFVDKMDPVTNEFLRRRLPVSEINKIYAERVPGALWLVRYFQDSQPEEYAVTLKPDGSVHAFRHTLPEAVKGVTISKEDAIALAEKFLREQKQIDLSQWKLVIAKSDKWPNRTDHTLTWQQNTPLDPEKSGAADSADHAYARIEMQILGDQPANYRTYIQIPEDFERQHDKQTLPGVLFAIGRILLILGLIVVVIVFYFKRYKTHPVQVPWRRLLLWGLVGLAAFALSFLLGSGITDLLGQYQTAFPFALFFGTQIGVVILQGGLVLGGILLLFGLAWNFAARAFGEEQIPTWLGMPGNYYRDAFWIGLGGAALLVGLRRVIDAATTWFPTLHRAYPAQFAGSFDAIYPAATVIGGAIVRALFLTGIIALAVSFLGAELRVRGLRLLLFLAVALSMVSNWGSPGDFLEQFLASVVVLGVIVFGIRQIARFNILGWFLIIAGTGLLSGAVELLSQHARFYQVQGYIVSAALFALLLWPLLMWRMKPQTTH